MTIPSMLLGIVQATMMQAGGADGAAAGATEAEAASLLDYILDAGLVSYLLIVCSIVAVALVIRNILVLRRSVVVKPDVVRQLESLLVAGNVREAERFCQQPENNCFVTRVFGQALVRCSRSPFGLMEVRAGAEEAGSAEVEGLHRLNDGVGIIAAVSPMLGLLGTVIGMIGAFQTIGSLTGSARSNSLAMFMSMALVNTAEGLVIAIPCTVAFALFRRRIESLTTTLTDIIERMIGHVQAISNAGASGGGGAARGPVAAQGGVSAGGAGAPMARGAAR
jgi:biopolymer transport protein ExbB